jgi:hypothetical protein
MGVLGAQTVIGVFGSPAAAEQARGVLLEAGVPEIRIALSVFTRSEEEKQYVEQLLLRNRAHHTVIRP